MEVVTCDKIPVIDFNGLNKKKKNGSGKTFYIQSYDQIEHLVNIFDEYLGTNGVKELKPLQPPPTFFLILSTLSLTFLTGKPGWMLLSSFQREKL